MRDVYSTTIVRIIPAFAEGSGLSGCRSWVFDFRLEDHPAAGLAIHDHGDRLIEMQEVHAAVCLDAVLRAQPLPIHKAFAGIGIHLSLIHTSDAADDLTRVDLGGRR